MTERTPAEWKAALIKIAPNGKPWIIGGFADALPGLATRFQIDTPIRQQHFIAQCAHECDHFNTTEEYASGAAYEGRKDLGNTRKGDGKRFKGRGLIQLTGRYNYEQASLELDQPYADDPALVAKFPAAATVSGWFWKRHGLNELADKDDVKAVTKRVNGGLNGLSSRTAALNTAKAVLA
jgi:putative chitinase